MARYTADNNTTFPDLSGVDWEWLGQVQKEKQNPGGVWIGKFYLEPGIDFGALAAADQANQMGTQVYAQEPPNFHDPVANAASTPVQAPSVGAGKSAAQVQAEAQQKANAEIDTNGDYLQGQAQLFSQLGEKNVGYDSQTNAANLGYEQFKLKNDRNTKDNLTAQANAFADRGTSIGGISQQATDKTYEAANLADTQANQNRQNTLAGLIAARAAAQNAFEQQRQALRQKITGDIVNRYISNAGNVFQ